MFSLGIILFELYFAPKTDMERIYTITSLKEKYKFPNDFENEWKVQVKLIQFKTNHFKAEVNLFFFNLKTNRAK